MLSSTFEVLHKPFFTQHNPWYQNYFVTFNLCYIAIGPDVKMLILLSWLLLLLLMNHKHPSCSMSVRASWMVGRQFCKKTNCQPDCVGQLGLMEGIWKKTDILPNWETQDKQLQDRSPKHPNKIQYSEANPRFKPVCDEYILKVKYSKILVTNIYSNIRSNQFCL